MEKRLVVSMACGEQSRAYSELTFPRILSYAKKCHADFHAVYELDPRAATVGYQKYNYVDFLNIYDRILHVDADMLFRSSTPDIFSLVPEDDFAGVNELPYEDLIKENPAISRVDDMHKFHASGVFKSLPFTPSFYINVGTYLFTKKHRSLFFTQKPNAYYKEQTQLNLELQLFKHKVTLLPWNFNYMLLMEWAGLNKDDAHIIHYAGGYGGKSQDAILRMMERDIR